MNKKKLPCPIRFRLSKFSSVLLGGGNWRENFPIRSEFYRVPVSTNWRRKSRNYDSSALKNSKSMSVSSSFFLLFSVKSDLYLMSVRLFPLILAV